MNLADDETLILSLPIIYGIFSLLAYTTYAFDKSAAVQKRRRISEDTLHLLSLFGGWPGALLAQRKYRHKTKKRRFRFFFWVTVILNIVILTWCLLHAKEINENIEDMYHMTKKVLSYLQNTVKK